MNGEFVNVCTDEGISGNEYKAQNRLQLIGIFVEKFDRSTFFEFSVCRKILVCITFAAGHN